MAHTCSRAATPAEQGKGLACGRRHGAQRGCSLLRIKEHGSGLSTEIGESAALPQLAHTPLLEAAAAPPVACAAVVPTLGGWKPKPKRERALAAPAARGSFEPTGPAVAAACRVSWLAAAGSTWAPNLRVDVTVLRVNLEGAAGSVVCTRRHVQHARLQNG